jgi:hypothetical protein
MSDPAQKLTDRESTDGTRIECGNARQHAMEFSAWFVGGFLDGEAGLRCSNDVEIKWGEHVAGEEKRLAGTNRTATSLALLVSGSFLVQFPKDGREILLDNRGDYVLYGPGVPHTWRAVRDSVVLTIRWPSLPDDQELSER